MAKYTEISEDTQEVFDNAFNNTTLENYISFEMLSSDKLRYSSDFPLCKILKTPSYLEMLKKGGKTPNVVIVVNDDLFIKLPVETQQYIAQKVWAGINVNTETGAVIVVKPNYQQHSLMVKQNSFETLEQFDLNIISVQEKYEEQLAEEKAAKKGKRKKSNF